MKQKIIFIKLACLLFAMVTCLIGCTTSSYTCPLKDLPGACSSQWKAYRATLVNQNAESDSIFENEKNSNEEKVRYAY